MNPLVFHIASGQAFFTGIGLMLAAALVSQWPQRICKRIAMLLFIVAIIAIAISSTAIPYWLYAVAVLGTLPWVFSGFRKEWQHWAPHCLMAGWLFAAAAEVPYHFSPTLRPQAKRAMMFVSGLKTFKKSATKR